MKVTVNISDREWWHLSELAEKNDAKISDMVMLGLKKTGAMTQDDMIHALVKAGLPDADIAGRLGIFVYQVATRRRWMGLKPNKRPANWGQKKEAA